MRHLIFVALCAAVVGCSRSRPTATLPAPTPVDRDTTLAKVEPTTAVATGELRTMMMQLERIHFPYDSDVLPVTSRDALERAAEVLTRHPEVALYVEGHSDARGTTEYNLALGDRRANAVIDYLVRLGVDRARLQPTSFGEERPLADGDHASAHAQNRRAEFRVMRGAVELLLEVGTPVDDAGTPITSLRDSRSVDAEQS